MLNSLGWSEWILLLVISGMLIVPLSAIWIWFDVPQRAVPGGRVWSLVVVLFHAAGLVFHLLVRTFARPERPGTASRAL